VVKGKGDLFFIQPAMFCIVPFDALNNNRNPMEYILNCFYVGNRYLDCGRDILASLQNLAKCPCGYCHIVDVESHEQDDHMESFFLAETVGYSAVFSSQLDNIVKMCLFLLHGVHRYCVACKY
jgi:hypothetical protein